MGAGADPYPENVVMNEICYCSQGASTLLEKLGAKNEHNCDEHCRELWGPMGTCTLGWLDTQRQNGGSASESISGWAPLTRCMT